MILTFKKFLAKNVGQELLNFSSKSINVNNLNAKYVNKILTIREYIKII